MRGDLVETTAADVCRELAARGASGILAIDGPGGPGRIVLIDGRIIAAVSPTPRARLGDRLVGAGELDPDDLADALALQREGDDAPPLGSLLVERGNVRHDAVRVFVQEQVLDALFEIVRWRYGAFAFNAGDAARDHGVPLSLSVDDALVEVARRQQEWRELSQVIPDLDSVPSFRAGAASASAALEPDEFAVLASVDGARSVRALAADLGYGEFEAARIVYGLSLLGIVDVRPPQDEIGAALEDALGLADFEESAPEVDEVAPTTGPATPPPTDPAPLTPEATGPPSAGLGEPRTPDPDEPPVPGSDEWDAPDTEGQPAAQVEDEEEPALWVSPAPDPATDDGPAEPPADGQPPRVEPSEVEPSGVEPSRVEPSRVEPSGAEPSDVEHADLEPSAAEPSTAEPSTVEPAEAASLGSDAPAGETDPYDDLANLDRLAAGEPPRQPAAERPVFPPTDAPPPAFPTATDRGQAGDPPATSDPQTPPATDSGPTEAAADEGTASRSTSEPADGSTGAAEHTGSDSSGEEVAATTGPSGNEGSPGTRRGDDADVSEFLRELSRLSVDGPSDSGGPRPPTRPTSSPGGADSEGKGDAKGKKRRGLFGRG